MALSEYEQQHIDNFDAALASSGGQRPYGWFSYIAFKKGDIFELWRGRLTLQWGVIQRNEEYFGSPNIRAGHCTLSEMGLTQAQFIEKVLCGLIEMPRGNVAFEADSGRSHSAYFEGGRSDNVHTVREQRLVIRGKHVGSPLGTADMEWELRASCPPYQTFADLCHSFGLTPVLENQSSIEIVSVSPALIAADSEVVGAEAEIVISLAEGLERKSAAISYIVRSKNGVADRGQLVRERIQWTMNDGLQRGVAKLPVQVGAIVHCYAVFNGHAHHQAVIFDPTTTQNPLRSAYEAVDKNLETLEQLLYRIPSKKQKDAGPFEAGVANLLWILGFNVMHLGETPQFNDAADVMVTTPGGHILLVECTTGGLKSDKVAQLDGRMTVLSESLRRSGNEHVRILAAMVTSKTVDELGGRYDEVFKEGKLVIAKDDFKNLLDITRTVTIPEQLFEEWEALVRSKRPSVTSVFE